MWELFMKGGPIMYLLLLISVVGLFIVINKLLFLKSNHINSELISEKIKNQLITVGKQQTIKNLRAERNLMLKTLTHVIRAEQTNPNANTQEAIKEATYFELPKLEKGMNVLSSIISVAPILGLLGTVLGLIDIFNVISGGGIGDPEALSAGIAQALITTVTGLSIAIPFIFLHQFLGHKIDGFILDTEKLMTEITHFVKSQPEVQP